MFWQLSVSGLVVPKSYWCPTMKPGSSCSPTLVFMYIRPDTSMSLMKLVIFSPLVLLTSRSLDLKALRWWQLLDSADR